MVQNTSELGKLSQVTSVGVASYSPVLMSVCTALFGSFTNKFVSVVEKSALNGKQANPTYFPRIIWVDVLNMAMSLVCVVISNSA